MARSDSFEGIIESRLDEIESWVEHGDTDKEIAEKLGISYSTYRKYKSNNVALKGRIATAKDKQIQEVEKNLFKKCKGYHYYEEVAFKVKEEKWDDKSESIIVEEHVEVRNVKKYSHPDLNAQKYFLNNRNKAKWKDDPNKVENDKKLTELKEKEASMKMKMIEDATR